MYTVDTDQPRTAAWEHSVFLFVTIPPHAQPPMTSPRPVMDVIWRVDDDQIALDCFWETLPPHRVRLRWDHREPTQRTMLRWLAERFGSGHAVSVVACSDSEEQSTALLALGEGDHEDLDRAGLGLAIAVDCSALSTLPALLDVPDDAT